MLHIFSLFLLLLLPVAAGAQVSADTVRGMVGKTVSVPLYLSLPAGNGWPSPVTLSGTLRLSNPTVFYPQRFIAPAGDSVVAFTIRAVKDSVYAFSITVRRDSANRTAGDTLAYLAGEALAGSDSVCVLRLDSLTLNGTPAADARGMVITQSTGTPLPYVRFATLEQNYPNPVSRNTPTTFAYRIDKRTDVRFHIYNLVGQELFVEHVGDTDIGPHLFIFTPEPTMPAGPYFVRLVTNSGTADKVMHILQ